MTCTYVVVQGSETRRELLCGEPADLGLCSRHERFLDKLAALTDAYLF